MKICIASKFAPTYLSGLAAYQRSLIRLLTERTKIAIQVISTTKANGFWPEAEELIRYSATKIRERPFGVISTPIRSRLASRPITLGLLEKMLTVSWDFPRNLNPDAILFAGNGWDFFGFAL